MHAPLYGTNLLPLEALTAAFPPAIYAHTHTRRIASSVLKNHTNTHTYLARLARLSLTRELLVLGSSAGAHAQETGRGGSGDEAAREPPAADVYATRTAPRCARATRALAQAPKEVAVRADGGDAPCAHQACYSWHATNRRARPAHHHVPHRHNSDSRDHDSRTGRTGNGAAACAADWLTVWPRARCWCADTAVCKRLGSCHALLARWSEGRWTHALRSRTWRGATCASR